MDENLKDYPVVKLVSDDDGWTDSYSLGCELDDLFPGQDATDFMVACNYNDWGPIFPRNDDGSNDIIGLLMVQQGENDGRDWIWIVRLANGEHWFMAAGCDYTGWDCQSNNKWEQIDPKVVEAEERVRELEFRIAKQEAIEIKRSLADG